MNRNPTQLFTTSHARWFSAVVGAAGAAVLGWLLLFTVLGGGLERGSYDWLFARKPIVTPPEVVLVNLDDESHEALNQPKNAPWDRALHAQLVERLHLAGARLVVFDILFDTEGTSEHAAADARLAAACLAADRVLLCGNMLRKEGRTTLVPPIAKLAASTRGWGFLTFPKDPDSAVRAYGVMDREVPLPGTSALPSLAWAAVQASAGAGSTTASPPETIWLNYYGPPETLTHVSYHQALDAKATPDEVFRDKVVFIGARRSVGFSGDGKDEYGTAFTRLTGQFSSGVEIHATAFLNLLRREWLTRPVPAVEAALVLLVAIAFGGGLVLLRPRWAVLVGLAGFVGVIGSAFWLFQHAQVWFAWQVLVLQILAGLSWAGLVHLYFAHVDNLLLQRMLSLHLPPARVQQAMRDPELRRPGGQKQELAFLFTDLDYFATISERVPSEKLFRQLNDYFTRAIACIHEHDGTLMRLTGDGVFAVWNAPVSQPNFAPQALRAALELRDRLRALEAEGADYPMHTRIGLHSGEACVGNCGSSERIDYTAIGSNVNIASRLESLNKHLKTDILASEDLVSKAGSSVLTRRVGTFRLKGCDRVMDVHEVVSVVVPGQALPPWIGRFHEALRHFQRREFERAAQAFEDTLQLRPKDGPSLFYLAHLRQMLAPPASDTWFGEIVMQEK